MTPYLLLLLFVTVTAYAGRRSGNRLIQRASLVLVGAMLVGFAGLRDSRVGTDTGTYLRHFNASEDFSIVFEQTDFSYYLISWLARSFSDSFAVLLLLIAAIVVTAYVSTVVRLVKRYDIAIYLFVTLSVYTFFFNGARQGIAAAICFAAVPFLLERRLWPYVGFVLLAATFHRTALIALPVYWFASHEVRWTRLLGLSVATAVAVGFLGVFVNVAANFLGDKYAQYAEVSEGGGEVWVTFLIVQGALLYWFKNYVSDLDGRYARLLNIYLVGLVPSLASVLSSADPSGPLRLHLYFSPISILLWPMVFQSIKNTFDRAILSIVSFIMTLLFFVLTTSTFSNLYPYYFNSSVF